MTDVTKSRSVVVDGEVKARARRCNPVVAALLSAACLGTVACADVTGDGGVTDEESGLLVRTAQGPVQGRMVDGARVFLGLPYAAPPTGDNRFRAPQPATVRGDTLQAMEYGPACAQLSKDKVEEGTSEDCLTLNIWAPKRVATPRAVLVFVHGGGFTSGSGSLPLYEGRHWAVTRDVVVVTLNYRLGPLGFFSHALLSAEAAGGKPSSNFGLLDQQAALAWVRDNIAGFGGDPKNVTLFGESAGGMSVCYQMLSPSAGGLFHRAVVQSGPCGTFTPPKQAAAEAQGNELAVKVGCVTRDPAATLRCLRAAPLDKLMLALPQKPEVVFGDGYAWTPSIGNSVLPAAPADQFPGGKFNQVPLIVGANKDEGTAFVALGVKLDSESNLRAALMNLFSAAAADAVIAHYGTPVTAETGLRVLGDAFVCDARRLARWVSAASVPTFYYNFTREFAYLLPDLGAFHGAELPYLFHTPMEFITIKPNEEDFAAQMQGYWTRFAESGDPNGRMQTAGVVPWPRYDRTGDRSQRLDLTTTTETGLRQRDCDFWDTLSP